MRSVFVYFTEASRADVAQFLDAHFSRGDGEHWAYHDRLLIGFYDDAEKELEPEEFAALQTRLKRRNVFAAVADVSGRTDGHKEAWFFCQQLLAHFSGFAMDDFSTHLWTLDEIRSGQRHEGHPFFDHAGWHDENVIGQNV